MTPTGYVRFWNEMRFMGGTVFRGEGQLCWPEGEQMSMEPFAIQHYFPSFAGKAIWTKWESTMIAGRATPVRRATFVTSGPVFGDPDNQ